MSDSQLSQDEIDALLDGVPAAPSGADADGAPAAHADGAAPATDGIDAVAESFDVACAGRFGNGRLPTLALVNERFTGFIETALLRWLGRRVTVAAETPTVTKYAAFTRALPAPSARNIVRMGPSCGDGLFVFDGALVYLAIDSLFGGTGAMPAAKSGVAFTSTEQRLVAHLVEMVFEHYQAAWASVHPMQFELLRTESETRFVNLAAPDDPVLAYSFMIESASATGAARGRFSICMPLANIDPIRDVIVRDTTAKNVVADRAWSERLAAQVASAEVELVADLATVPVTCKELIGMKVGDVIVLDIKPTIVASADGIPVLRCRYGNAEGRYAIRVDEVIAPSACA